MLFWETFKNYGLAGRSRPCESLAPGFCLLFCFLATHDVNKPLPHSFHQELSCTPFLNRNRE